MTIVEGKEMTIVEGKEEAASSSSSYVKECYEKYRWPTNDGDDYADDYKLIKCDKLLSLL